MSVVIKHKGAEEDDQKKAVYNEFKVSLSTPVEAQGVCGEVGRTRQMPRPVHPESITPARWKTAGVC